MNLTARESEVLSLIAKGMESDEIAARLGISAITVRSHAANIGNKLGTMNRVLLALMFHGLEQPRAPRPQRQRDVDRWRAYDAKRAPSPSRKQRARRNAALSLADAMRGWARP